MPPLPEAERRKFIEDALKIGAPPERIKRDLAQLEGREPLSVSIDPTKALTEARLPGGGLPTTPEEEAASTEFFTEKLPRIGLVTAGGLAAGPGIVPGAIGAVAGDIAFQAGRRIIKGTTISPGESFGAGAGALIGGMGGRIAVRAAGAVGGIAKEFLDYAGRSLRPFKKGEGYRLTFGRPPQEAELELGRKIQSTVEGAAKSITEGRLAKEALIKEATDAGKTVSVKPVVDKLREAIIPDATEASARNFNKRLTVFADRLEKRGSMTPEQFDVLMTKELSPVAFTGTGKPSLNRFAGAIRAARRAASETLEAAIPEVKAANQAAFEELTMREHAERVFGPSKLSLESKLINLFKPGREAEQQLLDRIGKEAGIPLLEEAKRLATKRAFTKDDRITAGVLNRVFLLTGTPQIARGIAKAGAPLQRFIGPVSGGATAGLEEELGP